LKGGGTIKEKLLAFDAAGRSFKYAILEGVLPVSDYTSTFAVKSVGKNRSSVTWTGHFKRKNVGDNPADNENDKTARDTIGGVYQGGLDNLKKIVEAK
jgi:mxaD protein